MNAIVSPTYDWKPSPAFPVIEGAVHWSVTSGSKWQPVAHGFTDTYEEAMAIVDSHREAQRP